MSALRTSTLTFAGISAALGGGTATAAEPADQATVSPSDIMQLKEEGITVRWSLETTKSQTYLVAAITSTNKHAKTIFVGEPRLAVDGVTVLPHTFRTRRASPHHQSKWQLVTLGSQTRRLRWPINGQPVGKGTSITVTSDIAPARVQRQTSQLSAPEPHPDLLAQSKTRGNKAAQTTNNKPVWYMGMPWLE